MKRKFSNSELWAHIFNGFLCQSRNALHESCTSILFSKLYQQSYFRRSLRSSDSAILSSSGEVKASVWIEFLYGSSENERIKVRIFIIYYGSRNKSLDSDLCRLDSSEYQQGDADVFYRGSPFQEDYTAKNARHDDVFSNNKNI